MFKLYFCFNNVFIGFMQPTECASVMVHDCQLWRPVCQSREVITLCISPLWTKTGVLQKLPANGLHISLVTHTP